MIRTSLPPAVGVVSPPHHLSREVATSGNARPAVQATGQGSVVGGTCSASTRGSLSSQPSPPLSLDGSNDDVNNMSPGGRTLFLTPEAREMREKLDAAAKLDASEDEDDRGGEEGVEKGGDLDGATASPRQGASTKKKPNSFEALKASIEKVVTPAKPYPGWSKDLLRRVCQHRGIGGLSTQRDKKILVQRLEELDGRKGWLGQGQVAYYGDLEQILAQAGMCVCPACYRQSCARARGLSEYLLTRLDMGKCMQHTPVQFRSRSSAKKMHTLVDSVM